MAPRGSSTDTHVHPAGGSAPAAASPPARRPSRSRWRDPRLVVGVAVVALCALLGARLLDGADDTVGVWVAAGALSAGQPVTDADLARRQVRFADQSDADRYLSADDAPPAGTVVDRPVGAGELLPRGALHATGPGSLTEVPLSVGTEAVPSTVHVGSVVDVWVTPERSGAVPDGRTVRSRLVFDDVPVVSAPQVASALGPTSTRQVIVGVGPDQRGSLPVSIAALTGGTVLLTAPR